MSELLPCPFCGGEAHIMKDIDRYAIGCSCDTCMGFIGLGWLYETKAEAIEAWNTRVEQMCERVTHGLERDREIATVSWTCSECGEHMGRDYNYCPNCGRRVVNNDN